jgi:hypothetical protein
MRAGSAMVVALSPVVLLAGGSVASARPVAAGGSCSTALNGYKPQLAATYLSTADSTYIPYITKIKEKPAARSPANLTSMRCRELLVPLPARSVITISR